MADHLKMPVHEQWACGHVATAMCAECHRELAQRANALAEENERLRSDKLHWEHQNGLLEAENERLRLALDHEPALNARKHQP